MVGSTLSAADPEKTVGRVTAPFADQVGVFGDYVVDVVAYHSGIDVTAAHSEVSRQHWICFVGYIVNLHEVGTAIPVRQDKI